MMNDDNLDLRQLLRTFYVESRFCATDGEREQLITKIVKKIQACRFCAFEKEQQKLFKSLKVIDEKLGW